MQKDGQDDAEDDAARVHVVGQAQEPDKRVHLRRRIKVALFPAVSFKARDVVLRRVVVGRVAVGVDVVERLKLCLLRRQLQFPEIELPVDVFFVEWRQLWKF